MADNITYPGPGVSLLMTVAGASSGDVVAFVDLVGVALEDTGETVSGKATVKLPVSFVADVSVHAVNNAGNVAVSIGDKLYWDSTEVNKDATNGKAFGYALEAIGSGETDTILVGFGL